MIGRPTGSYVAGPTATRTRTAVGPLIRTGATGTVTPSTVTPGVSAVCGQAGTTAVIGHVTVTEVAAGSVTVPPTTYWTGPRVHAQGGRNGIGAGGSGVTVAPALAAGDPTSSGLPAGASGPGQRPGSMFS